jgi:hypothetical protein
MLENVKESCLKKALLVSKYVASSLVRVLAKDFFLNEDEDMENNLLLPSTRASERMLQNIRNKEPSIWEEFCDTYTMRYQNWIEANYEVRHGTST